MAAAARRARSERELDEVPRDLMDKQVFIRNNNYKKMQVQMENPRAFRLVPILDGSEIHEVICKKNSYWTGQAVAYS